MNIHTNIPKLLAIFTRERASPVPQIEITTWQIKEHGSRGHSRVQLI